MKNNMVLLIYILMSGLIYGKDITYNMTYSFFKTVPKGAQEIITHQKNGFKRVTVLHGKEIIIYSTTNSQQETTELIFIQDNVTNRYFVQDNNIYTPYGQNQLKDNKFIAFPEIQLASFVTDFEQEELNYFFVRTDNKQVCLATATKIRENCEIVVVQINFKGVSPLISRYLYYYSRETGVAFKKESYFFSKKPFYIMKSD